MGDTNGLEPFLQRCCHQKPRYGPGICYCTTASTHCCVWHWDFARSWHLRCRLQQKKVKNLVMSLGGCSGNSPWMPLFCCRREVRHRNLRRATAKPACPLCRSRSKRSATIFWLPPVIFHATHKNSKTFSSSGVTNIQKMLQTWKPFHFLQYLSDFL